MLSGVMCDGVSHVKRVPLGETRESGDAVLGEKLKARPCSFLLPFHISQPNTNTLNHLNMNYSSDRGS